MISAGAVFWAAGFLAILTDDARAIAHEGGALATSEKGAQSRASAFEWDVGGSYALYGTLLGPIVADAFGTEFGQRYLVEHRMRLQPQATIFGQAKLHADLQLAAGYLAVEEPTPDIAGFGPPRGRDGLAFGGGQRYGNQLALRQIYLAWTTPVGLLMAGRMVSMWGMGLLANSGDDTFGDDWGAPRLGENRTYGDVSNRVLFATTPFRALTDAPWAQKLAVGVGADLIQHDDLTHLAAGDVAIQGLGLLRYAADEHNQVGVYVAYRDSRDRTGETLQVWAYDAAGRFSQRLGDVRLYGVGEVGWISGRTSLGRSSALDPNLLVQQLGGVLRLGAAYMPWGAALDGELGYASGDSNPFDGHLRNFVFDPNYRPSLVMFRELQAAQTVTAAAHAADPNRVGQPQASLRYLPTAGGVTNAIYVRPTARYDFLGGLQGLSVRLAGLWGFAEEDVVDPFTSTFEGRARNYRGGDPSSRYYGFELDVGLDYTQPVGEQFELTASLQLGRLWPGQAFADATGHVGRPVDAGFLRVSVQRRPAVGAGQ